MENKNKNKKKNFNIVRYFVNDVCVKGTHITKSDAKFMMMNGIMPSSIAYNGAGGISTWYDLDIKPRPFEKAVYDEDDFDEDED